VGILFQTKCPSLFPFGPQTVYNSRENHEILLRIYFSIISIIAPIDSISAVKVLCWMTSQHVHTCFLVLKVINIYKFHSPSQWVTAFLNINKIYHRPFLGWVYVPDKQKIPVNDQDKFINEMSTRLVREFIPISINVGNDSYDSFRQWKKLR
jgi:hypothetical protein